MSGKTTSQGKGGKRMANDKIDGNESDTSRLDWLNANPDGVDYFEGGWYISTGISPHPTLREAIDEAMGRGKGDAWITDWIACLDKFRRRGKGEAK